MFAAPYRLPFARRATWALHHPATDGRMRYTLYDPTPEDVRLGWESVREILAGSDG